MEINDEILETLEQAGIDKSAGLTYLLSVYFGTTNFITDINIINTINLTKIVEIDYNTGNIVWNTPLFKTEVSAQEFDWVWEWAKPFFKINPTRTASRKDLILRMKKFFASYPEYRKEDVIKARDMYIKSLTESKYIKSPLKFIMEGQGSYKTSPLLGWCEKIKESSPDTEEIRGLLK